MRARAWPVLSQRSQVEAHIARLEASMAPLGDCPQRREYAAQLRRLVRQREARRAREAAQAAEGSADALR